MKPPRQSNPTQLELPLAPVDPGAVRKVAAGEPVVAAIALPVAPPPAATPRTGLRVIQGGGQRVHEPLASRDAVVRVLVEAGADLLLRRISSERAEYIEKSVDQILTLFDQVDAIPHLLPVLKKQLDDLEQLMTETRSSRTRRQG